MTHPTAALCRWVQATCATAHDVDVEGDGRKDGRWVRPACVWGAQLVLMKCGAGDGGRGGESAVERVWDGVETAMGVGRAALSPKRSTARQNGSPRGGRLADRRAYSIPTSHSHSHVCSSGPSTGLAWPLLGRPRQLFLSRMGRTATTRDNSGADFPSLTAIPVPGEQSRYRTSRLAVSSKDGRDSSARTVGLSLLNVCRCRANAQLNHGRRRRGLLAIWRLGPRSRRC